MAKSGSTDHGVHVDHDKVDVMINVATCVGNSLEVPQQVSPPQSNKEPRSEIGA